MPALHPEFKLPKDGLVYTEAILERCRCLISTGIWQGIPLANLDSWFNNFDTDEKRYFGACVLDSLIYRSAVQTDALIDDLFERLVPDATTKPNPRNPLQIDWTEQLRLGQRTTMRPVVIVPVIRKHDPPTKSGPLVARMLRRRLRFAEHLMIWPWQLKEQIDKYQVKAILFVDDFLGTGRQFRTFIKSFDLESHLARLFCIYAPLVAHEKGAAHLNRHFPELTLLSAEFLTHECDFLGAKSIPANDGVNSQASVRGFYNTLGRSIGYGPQAMSTGYGRLGLTFSFEHATPNNSLPLLWCPIAGWKPLFTR